MKTETILVAAGSGSSNDTLVFADGSVSSLATINFVKGTASAPVPGGETSLAPNFPTTLNATVKAVALDATGETFALASPGMSFKLLGSSGVDTVYVKSGTTVARPEKMSYAASPCPADRAVRRQPLTESP